MLIDGEKWACEACIRGHRVFTCKHHDRPLTRINRKGRPFSTCSICNCTPCTSPDEHNRLKRAAEQRSQSQNRASGRRTRLSPSAFLPIAPRPAASAPPPATQTPSFPAEHSHGSHPSDHAAIPEVGAAAAATAAVGDRRPPQGAPQDGTPIQDHNPTAISPPLQYAHPDPARYNDLSPAGMPLGSFSPPLCSMSHTHVSLSMVNPFDDQFVDPSLLDGGGGSVGFGPLEDLDLSLQDDMMPEDWKWLADDHS
ncbi:copper fist DNA binding domain-containing protein [Aspergillus egyptiacus]|nr:copper fist DNA binding domain-containing protein [Aspergillus egyptiacus]